MNEKNYSGTMNVREYDYCYNYKDIESRWNKKTDYKIVRWTRIESHQNILILLLLL